MTIVYVIQLCVPCSGILIKCFVCYYYACIKCIVRVPCVICFVLVGRADHALVMIKDDGCTSVVQLYRINEDKALLKGGSDVTVTWSDGKIYDATFLLSGKKNML